MKKELSKNHQDHNDELSRQALFYHCYPRPGKLEIQATKPLGNQRDLALAYSPGVAAPCLAIHKNPEEAARYTARSNLVAVISNGSAVLGLGNIGPLAAKPVMEGKAVLFKKFADVDVFDIEINAQDIDSMVSTISALEPTFGGINLEDIKSPECFEVERILSEKMNIPVFHDDQHGTAITVAAAVLNGLDLAGKKLSDIKIVTLGAGAAALACLNLLISLGAKRENIWVHDVEGIVYKGRQVFMDRWKEAYAQDTDKRKVSETIQDADVFLGLSVAGALDPQLIRLMAKTPLIFSLANPVPEIMPDIAREIRADAIICTGRSDFPNQVNNVLCFPYIFRGALDCGATMINEEMKMAAVRAIASLARDMVFLGPSGEARVFGPNYIIPSPFDPNLLLRIAPAVAKAAAETGVASRPIENFDAYYEQLNRFAFRSALVMKPIFALAKSAPTKRVVFSEGEDERVLRAAQILLEENIARPILIGRPNIIKTRLKRYGLKILPEKDFDITNPEKDVRFREYVDLYLSLVGRQGVIPEAARTIVRTNMTVIGALTVKRGEADAMICGLEGRYECHLKDVRQIIGYRNNVKNYSALSLLISQRSTLFFVDTYVSFNPSAEEIAESTVMAAEAIRAFGIVPRAALLSHSNFGSLETESSLKMYEALQIIKGMCPDLEIDGEMNGESALSEILRKRAMPSTHLFGEANLLIFPNLDAANITLGVVKSITDGLHVGPILLGSALPAHILSPSVTSRGVVNMASVGVAEAFNRVKNSCLEKEDYYSSLKNL
ncbi:NADP-dependent malic enzyme [Liberibacter crescens BT-1]|uniref:NADP-dependent malic enzyme n=1 Tax=Liberibacter crescens (strain BT-1) TaxID=1215343 RepID=L0EVD7_LIBCB|nr:NADP-dependent malic enzyme [Liberibacter crescens]AGA64820.1 NADP-dependent malic enzyme [Liberibacter crescens BT-1]